MEKEPQKKKAKKKLKEISDEDELNDLKKTNLLKNSIENKINDESDVIEQKNLRFSL